MTDPTLYQLLARVASLYYEEEKTQNEIASLLGLSRVKVYRLLKQAKAEQVVQITVNWPIARDARLEEALCRRFGLAQALVLTRRDDEAAARREVAQLAARHLEQTLADGMTLAVCLGSLTAEVISAIRPGFRARVRVAQAMGSLPQAGPALDSAGLARRLAGTLGGEALYLSAPLLADSPAAAAVLRGQSEIGRALEAAAGADIALVGVGSLDPAVSKYAAAGVLSVAELGALAGAGAVGELAGQVFDAGGRLLPTPIAGRIIGLTLDDLRRIPTVVAVAMGRAKAAAIAGALRTGALRVLVTDAAAAEEMMRRAG